jgi:hypothetical protein
MGTKFITTQEDLEAVREFKAKLAAGKEELIPADGENKVRVWRDYIAYRRSVRMLISNPG